MSDDGINFAERDRQLMDNPTMEDCRRMGATHRAYGWAFSPWGHWSAEQKAEYRKGYDGQDGR